MFLDCYLDTNEDLEQAIGVYYAYEYGKPIDMEDVNECFARFFKKMGLDIKDFDDLVEQCYFSFMFENESFFCYAEEYNYVVFFEKNDGNDSTIKFKKLMDEIESALVLVNKISLVNDLSR